MYSFNFDKAFNYRNLKTECLKILEYTITVTPVNTVTLPFVSHSGLKPQVFKFQVEELPAG